MPMVKTRPLIKIKGGKKNTFENTTAFVGENDSLVELEDTEGNTFSRTTLIKKAKKKKWFISLMIAVAATVIGGGILFYLGWK